MSKQNWQLVALRVPLDILARIDKQAIHYGVPRTQMMLRPWKLSETPVKVRAPKDKPPPAVVTIEEAAGALSVDYNHVLLLMRQGYLKSYRIGKVAERRVIPVAEIDRYRRTQPTTIDGLPQNKDQRYRERVAAKQTPNEATLKAKRIIQDKVSCLSMDDGEA